MNINQKQIFLCTPENPWNKNINDVRVQHSRLREISDQRDGWPSGDYVTMKCLNCGHEFEVELPQ